MLPPWHAALSYCSIYVCGLNFTILLLSGFPEAGHIRFDSYEMSLPYSYNALDGNANDRTLAQFSTSAKDKMKPCTHCELYPEFKKFFQFYGREDYAHRWIMSAFDATRVVFESCASDFTIYSLEARSRTCLWVCRRIKVIVPRLRISNFSACFLTEAVLKAVVTMDVFMYTIRMLEESVHQCRLATEEKTSDAGKSSEKALKDLDGAVAFYAGSSEDGSGSGVFLYALADAECKEFKTCGPGSDATRGTAKVNIEVMQMMDVMKANTTTLHCSEARKQKETILRKMRIPLIQGTLRYAYMRKHNQVTGTEKAVGAAYAASVVPLVASCNFHDAEIIGEAMDTMTKQTDFAMVKRAFENNYACLAITCADVGGYWSVDKNQYHEGASPCSSVSQENAEQDKKKRAGWAIAVPLCVIFAVFCFVKRRKSKKKKKGGGGSQDDEFSDYSSSSEDSDDFRFS